MVIWTAKVSGKKIFLAILGLAAAVFLGACVVNRFGAGDSVAKSPALETNEDRVAYLAELGWAVQEEPIETLRFQIPEILEEPYLSYNALQLPQGFDLSRHRGEQAERFTYAVTNYPDRPSGVQVNLYLCGGVPVAGDILCPGADGFQEPMIQAREGQK